MSLSALVLTLLSRAAVSLCHGHVSGAAVSLCHGYVSGAAVSLCHGHVSGAAVSVMGMSLCALGISLEQPSLSRWSSCLSVSGAAVSLMCLPTSVRDVCVLGSGRWEMGDGREGRVASPSSTGAQERAQERERKREGGREMELPGVGV